MLKIFWSTDTLIRFLEMEKHGPAAYKVNKDLYINMTDKTKMGLWLTVLMYWN